MRTSSCWHVSQSLLYHRKKKRYLLRDHNIFAFFVFGLIFFPSCSCLPLKYVVFGISPLNASATWHTVYYQESNFLEKTLFIVFGVVEAIATFSSWWFYLLVPRFGSRHMKDSMAYGDAILWNNVSFINWKQTSTLNIWNRLYFLPLSICAIKMKKSSHWYLNVDNSKVVKSRL